MNTAEMTIHSLISTPPSDIIIINVLCKTEVAKDTAGYSTFSK